MTLLKYLLLIPVLGIMACTPNIVRPHDTEDIDVSGLWNDVDARKISDEMSVKITSGNWIANGEKRFGAKPVIKFGKVIVRMDDGSIVNTDIFINAIRNSLLNSGKVTIKADTNQSHVELQQQADYSENRKKLGVEIASDLLLTGKITCQNDQGGRKSVKYIIADFEIMDVQSGELIWADRATPIKKVVTQDRYK